MKTATKVSLNDSSIEKLERMTTDRKRGEFISKLIDDEFARRQTKVSEFDKLDYPVRLEKKLDGFRKEVLELLNQQSETT